MEEMNEKILTGRSRVKKRTRTVQRTEQVSVKNEYKGTFVEYGKYKEAGLEINSAACRVPIRLDGPDCFLLENQPERLLAF